MPCKGLHRVQRFYPFVLTLMVSGRPIKLGRVEKCMISMATLMKLQTWKQSGERRVG